MYTLHTLGLLAELGLYVPSCATVRYVQSHLFAYYPTQRKNFTYDVSAWNCDLHKKVFLQEFEITAFLEAKKVLVVPLHQQVTIHDNFGTRVVENQLKTLSQRNASAEGHIRLHSGRVLLKNDIC